MKRILLFLISFTLNLSVFYRIECVAQPSDSYTVWLLPSVQYEVSESVVCALQPGWNPQLSIGLLYANATVKVNRWMNINIGYLFLDLPRQNNNEWTLMNGITLKTHLNKFSIDYQNLIWNRFRSIHESYHFDRNRFRLFHELTIHKLTVNPYLFEECWFYLNNKNISRNRTGMGVLFTIKRRYTLDLLYTRQWDRFDGDSSVLFFRSALFIN